MFCVFNFIDYNVPSKILRWDNTVIKSTSFRFRITWTQLLWTVCCFGLVDIWSYPKCQWQHLIHSSHESHFLIDSNPDPLTSPHEPLPARFPRQENVSLFF